MKNEGYIRQTGQRAQPEQPEQVFAQEKHRCAKNVGGVPMSVASSTPLDADLQRVSRLLCDFGRESADALALARAANRDLRCAVDKLNCGLELELYARRRRPGR